MKKIVIIIAALTVILSASICSAEQRLADSIGVDRFAHFGVSYAINDQLHRNCGMNKFWAGFTTLCIGAAKEKWIDKKWDNGDFAADCAGVLVYTVTF